ncbi:RHS repeat-associated protein [Catenulispora sp. GP43]|uniref:DUF6531 domain-containing protein n=1 Tax=Catenulispora sp. GP43 TaxID=3156263 RepID=UPI0035111675
MARPSGWDILGLDGDPTPGVVESVQALAKQFGDFAHDVEAAYRSLNSFGSDTAAMQWVGQTADAFKNQYGPLPGRLQKLYTSYSEASDALSAYWPALQAAQTKADAALRQAQDAHADLQRATTNANTAATDLKTAQQNHAANPNPQAVTDAQTAHDTAQTNLDNAKARMADLTKQANDADNDRITAAKTCASALHKAQGDGIHNKSWWDHVAEDLSEWGGKIAEIANDLAPFLDVLALATSWIPGVDVVTAALAEADNIIAMVGTGIEVLGDAMQGHWGDALMGAGMLGLTLLGGKAIEKFGGKALESLSSKFGKEAEAEVEGSVGAEARAADGNKLANEAGDPVDIVSGQMITTALDISLPGILPVVLRRSYASGYANGRLFGPGWSSTLDQRLSINQAGIHFVGDDAQTLHYPIPTGNEAVLPERGARWPLVWDRESDEIRITDPISTQSLHFDVDHYHGEIGSIRDLTAISDRNGNRIHVERDVHGTPRVVAHPAYRLAIDTVVTDAGPRVTGVRLLDGTESGVPVSEYRYDGRGCLAGVVDSSGVPYRYEYDYAGRITAWVDRLGYRYTYEYDSRGRVTRGVGADGRLDTKFGYREEDLVTVVTDSLGQATSYRYDENGHLVAVVDAAGGVATAQHDLYGSVLASSDPIGRTTRFDLDARGLPSRIVLPGDGLVEFERDELGRSTVVAGPDGAVWQYQYDDHGNLVKLVDPEGAETVYHYNGFGGLEAVIDAVGQTTRLTVDAAGLATTITDPTGATTSVVRDPFGRVIRIDGPLGERTELWWTTEGRELARVLPGGAREEWEYDAGGHLVSRRGPAGATERFEYGPFDLMTAQILADGSRLEYAHDTELRLVEVTNSAGDTWTYEYDAVNNLRRECDFNGRDVVYTYDAAGQMLTRRVAGGPLLSFDRDVFGNVIRRSCGVEESRFSYDRVGNLMRAVSPTATLEYTRDRVGRLLTETVDGRTVRNTYDAGGRRTRRESPTGVVSQWQHDAAGRPSVMSGTVAALSFAYDEAGREVERQLSSAAVLRQAYDASGRLSSQRIQLTLDPDAAPQLVQDREYRYLVDGAVSSIHDRLRGDRSYALDLQRRVTTVQAAQWQETYAYDASGNLAFSDGPAAAPEARGERETNGTLVRRAGRTTYDYDDQRRLIRTVRRTLSGQRRQWHYEWDAENRLKAVTEPDGTTWRYEYDPLGRRIAKHQMAADGTSSRTITFSWDGSHLAEQAETDSAGRTEVLTWDYEPDSFRVAAQTRRTWSGLADIAEAVVDAEFHAIVTDLVGTPMELVASDGGLAWRWNAGLWGQGQHSSGEGADCPLRFPGQYHDPETGWNYNLFRYYDSENARYVTPDPMGLAPAPNQYAYVDNPLGWTDPLGLITYDQAKKVAQKVQQRAQDGTTRRAPNWHGHIDPQIEEEILKNPDAVYYSTGTGERLTFRKGDDIVILDGRGATKGHIVTSYGPSGVLGDSGVKAYPNLGLKATDPGMPVTHSMVVNGQIPNGKGGFIAPAKQIGWP